jgi:hypothetical protein
VDESRTIENTVIKKRIAFGFRTLVINPILKEYKKSDVGAGDSISSSSVLELKIDINPKYAR